MIIPNAHLSHLIDRKDMPQISADRVMHFFNLHHAEHAHETVGTGTLKPTQGEFNVDKIANMGDTAKGMPIMVSKDNFVLDGHHRWLANHIDSGSQRVIRTPWDLDESLDKMREYDHVFYKGVHEDEAPAVSIGNGAMDNEVVVPKKKKTFLAWRTGK